MIKMYWWEGYYGFKRTFTRALTGMRPYVNNFGDQLSPFIIAMLSGMKIKHTLREGKILGLGSIFFCLRQRDTVWGAGLLNSNHLHFAMAAQDVNYRAVRGPKTRSLLVNNGIACPEVYGDPALLLPLLVKNDIDKRWRIGIVPHFSHYRTFKTMLNHDLRVKVIDVEKPFHDVIREILSCEVIFSSSLHGLIVAEAYGIDALMLTVGKPLHGDLFKFDDYFASTGRPTFYADFIEVSDIKSLVAMAMNNPKPNINIHPLLDAFPFECARGRAKHSDTGWSRIHGAATIYRSSIRPPCLLIPEED